MFDNINDAIMRIKDSVVRYKNQPVYISKVFENDEHTLYASFLNLITKEKRLRVFLKSKHFDFTAFPIGYINSENLGAIYAARRAVRKYKAGLSLQNIEFINLDRIPEDVLYSRGLGKTIVNDYPSIEEAYRNTKAKLNYKVAFSREYAFYRSNLGIIYLEYKTEGVGFVKDVKDDSPYVRLGEEFKYMAQELAHKGVQLL